MAKEGGPSDLQKSINESTDRWRASQGLPPIDRSEEARHPDEKKSKKETPNG